MMFVSSTGRVLTYCRRSPLLGKTDELSAHQSGMSSFPSSQAGPCRTDGPPADVTEWRRCRLVEAGFPLLLAIDLARTSSVDVHELLRLVDRGCPPDLAARILAPLGASA